MSLFSIILKFNYIEKHYIKGFQDNRKEKDYLFFEGKFHINKKKLTPNQASHIFLKGLYQDSIAIKKLENQKALKAFLNVIDIYIFIFVVSLYISFF